MLGSIVTDSVVLQAESWVLPCRNIFNNIRISFRPISFVCCYTMFFSMIICVLRRSNRNWECLHATSSIYLERMSINKIRLTSRSSKKVKTCSSGQAPNKNFSQNEPESNCFCCFPTFLFQLSFDLLIQILFTNMLIVFGLRLSALA